MRALVIRQPWANLIVLGRKTIETRFRRTNIQEPFLIVAGKTFDETAMHIHGPRPAPGMDDSINPPIIIGGGELIQDILDALAGSIHTPFPAGMAIGIARIYKVEPMTKELEAAALCPTQPGLWAWHLGNVRRIQPFAVRGMPGFFNVDLKGRSL